MNRSLSLISLALLPLALSALSLNAQARSDADFMKDAATAGITEINAAKLAATKAKAHEVKIFAQTMLTEHTKVADELKSLAGAKHVDLPAEPTSKQKTELKALNAGSDDQFDARYLETFGVKAHEDTIKLFEEASKDAKDLDVKAWAQKTLPGLKRHLEMAQALRAKVAKATN